MSVAASWSRRIAETVGIRITRQATANRFQAAEACLSRMRTLGYEPKVIVDGGANVGQFHRLAQSIFPDAYYHLIEPQPSCAVALRELVAARPGRSEYHPIAITRPGVSCVRMTGCGSTGSYVTNSNEPSDLEVPATSLDNLFDGKLLAGDRTLLKLDLEAHELDALLGAQRILPVVETILIEVSFYDVNDEGRKTFSDILFFLRDAGFDLYDVASLSHRSRDRRLRLGDVVFVRRGTPLLNDNAFA